MYSKNRIHIIRKHKCKRDSIDVKVFLDNDFKHKKPSFFVERNKDLGQFIIVPTDV